MLRRLSRAAALAAALLSIAPPALAEPPAWQVCFTPGQDCTGLVVAEIASAHRSILVQAYSFTSVPILAALKAAHARGVDVELIIDKTSARVSKSGLKYSAATYLSNAGIPVEVGIRPLRGIIPMVCPWSKIPDGCSDGRGSGRCQA
jgi:phosphatidylserine/phosphatidylglycerophosphate/cardiolipin synthase-like enzyme